MEKYWRKLLQATELRKRILITLVLLLLTRVLVHIPLSNVTDAQIRSFFGNNSNSTLGLLDMFSGGSLQKFSIILMGVGPYITASIIIQLLQVIVPSFEALSKEGESGQQKLNQYTRYLTVPLAILQSYATLTLLKSQNIISDWTAPQLIGMLIASCAGTLLLMWIGEIISEKGIGNGISLIITIGILAGMPSTFIQKYQLITAGGSIDTTELLKTGVFILTSLVLIAVIVVMNDAVRKIPIIYARRAANNSGTGVSSYLPIKVNIAGVIPIIFAISMLIFPQIIGKFFENAKSGWLSESAKWLATTFSSQSNALVYGITYFILVIVFTYFYTSLILSPTKIADNLQKQSGFIPGIRPGNETSSYLSALIGRITFVGSIFLGLVAVLPVIIPLISGDQSLILGGTGILIVVSVVIETMRQINAQIVMASYDRY